MNKSEPTADMITRNRRLLSLATEACARAQDVRLQAEDAVHRAMAARQALQQLRQRSLRTPFTMLAPRDLP